MKKQYPCYFIIFLFVGLVIFTRMSNSYTFPLEDNVNDVAHFINYKFQDQGDYFDEIDIIRLEKNGTNLELTVQGYPKIDYNHRYSYIIHWDGNETSYTNYSIASFGSTFYHEINNSIMTHLENSCGEVLVQNLVNDVIYIDERKVIMPILNHSLIENPDNPSWLLVSASYLLEDLFGINYWVDYLPDYDWWIVEPTNSQTESAELKSIIYTISMCTIAGIAYNRKKKSKKNRFNNREKES